MSRFPYKTPSTYYNSCSDKDSYKADYHHYYLKTVSPQYCFHATECCVQSAD
uniref:Uncharacterized protein n=1 Tax=Arion vulgaris TaxID=1028688 RepID=A0A0B7B117_9EUPU